MLRRMSSIRKEAYFSKLFFTITLFTTAIVFALSVFLYFSFQSFSLSLVNSSNEKLMKQVFSNIKQIDSYVKTYAYSLFNHPDTSQLMLAQAPSIVDTLSSLQSINTTLSTAPFLYSAYVYNGRTDTYYTIGPDPVIREHDFYDTEIVKLLGNQEKTIEFAPIPRQMPLSAYQPDRTLDVYTYIIADYFTDKVRLKNALVVNVRMDWIFNMLSSYSDSDSLNGSNIMILDRSGTVIADMEHQLFLKNISGESYVTKALSATDQSGVFLADVNGESSVVTYTSDESSDWVLLNIVPYKYIAGAIHKVKSITLSIALSMLLICFTVAYLLARNLYSPVRRLRTAVGQLSGQRASPEDRDEFRFISNTFSSVQENLRSLESFKQSNKHIFKQNALRDLLASAAPRNYEALFQQHHIALDPFGPVLLVLWRLDGYQAFGEKYNKHDQSLLKYALMNMTEEKLLPFCPCECIDPEEDHIVVLLGCEEQAADQLIPMLRQVQGSYLEYCSLSVSAFIGEAASSIREIHLLYKHLLSFSNHRIVAGHGCMLSVSDVPADTPVGSKLEGLFDQLADSIRKGRLEPMELAFKGIMDVLKASTYNEIMFALSMLTVSVFQTLSLLEKNSTLSFDLDFISFDRKIKMMETLGEIEAEFLGIFRSIANSIHQSKDDRTVTIVENAARFIELNYKNKALSTTLVADHYQLTAAYLGKLFREYKSQSIAEYITAVRLEKAGSLLRETQLGVDELIEQIGWENKKYFFTVFKKRFGATPTEYRLKAALEGLNNASS